MKGLELSRLYYQQEGIRMLDEQFPGLRSKIAVGLIGSGSECYGYDDEISQDHDFEPGFCLFLPDEDIVDDKTAFLLEKAYNKLPKTFMGYSRPLLSPVGGNRHGVFRVSEYFENRIGSRDGSLSVYQWLNLPEYVLLECINGDIFEDEGNFITSIRQKLEYYPEDIRKKKIAGYLIMMNQSGQYNYERCLQRNDHGAAALCLNEFVNAVIYVTYRLNRRYTPYYKWMFTGLRQLEKLSVIAEFCEYLLNSGSSETETAAKKEMIRNVSALIIDELQNQKLTESDSDDLEKQAENVNRRITDNNIRNMNILAGV